MKRFFFFFLIIFYLSNANANANAEDIKLISTEYSSTKECKSFKKLKATDNFEEIRERFDITKEDYLTVSLKNKKNQVCYTMAYYPDASAFLYFEMSDRRIQITEMSGTASSGNWFDKVYKIDKKTQKLRYIETKFHH